MELHPNDVITTLIKVLFKQNSPRCHPCVRSSAPRIAFEEAAGCGRAGCAELSAPLGPVTNPATSGVPQKHINEPRDKAS